jgi:PAS domain S-box-containing protein
VNEFLHRNITKFGKLNREQARHLFVESVDKIDRYETVLNSLSRGLLVCDERGGLIMTNKAAERLVGVSNDAVGKRVWPLLRDVEMSDFVYEALLAGDKVSGHEFALGGDRALVLSLDILPLARDGHVIGSLLIVDDITERKNAESKARRLESLARLSTLTAGVAHEIKNPLASISIHLQLLEKMMVKARDEYIRRGVEMATPYDKAQHKIVIIKEEIDRLNSVIVEFLLAVRPMNFQFYLGDINKLITNILSFLQEELAERKVEVKVELDEHLPEVMLDERYMKQALLNLVKNALEAMPEGGRLTVRTGVADRRITVSVADTGVGMSEDAKARIFEPYFTTKPTGTGLGLMLVYQTVQGHGGEIMFESQAGAGTTFTITLPLAGERRQLTAPEE